MSEAAPQRLGSAYFLAFCFFGLAVLLWLRGFGRLLVPLLIIGLIAYAVHRVLKKIREPVD